MDEGHRRGREPTNDEQNKMYSAIQDDDARTIEKMITTDGIDVNAVMMRQRQIPGGKWAALHWAVYYNKVHIIKKLVELGAGITDTDAYNDTPLDMAIERNYTAIVHYFINNHTQVITKIKQENKEKLQGMEKIKNYLEHKANAQKPSAPAEDQPSLIHPQSSPVESKISPIEPQILPGVDNDNPTTVAKDGPHHEELVTTVIPKGKSRNDKPVLKELLQNVIHQYAAHWEDLGILLGMEDYYIANIARDYHNQSVDACREMLMMWLRVAPSPTWGKLDDAINSMKIILASKPSGTDKPNIILLNNHVREEAAPQWHDLGEQLLMKALIHKLDVIGEEYKGDNKRCCSEMFAYWLADHFEATWKKMLHTLEQTGHSEIAATVKRNDTIKDTDKPTLRLLNKYFRDKVAPHWYDFGIQLLEDECIEQLDIIEKNHPGDVQRCCTEMFKYWLKIEPEPTWDKLAVVSEDIGQKVLAKKIKDVVKGLPAPNNVRATVLSHSSVEVTWDQLSDATEYTISYSTTASHKSDRSATVKGSSTTSHTITNLEGNTPYTITVQATNRDGRKSALSNEVSIRTPDTQMSPWIMILLPSAVVVVLAIFIYRLSARR